MIYQFEHEEIKKCIRCPMWVFPEMATMPLCNLTGETIPKGSTPQENDCPLVTILQGETTSCEWCEIASACEYEVTFFKDDDRWATERSLLPKFCPNCGRDLKGE